MRVSRVFALTGAAGCGKMGIVKRSNQNLNYTPKRRGVNFDATSGGPLLKLALGALIVLALVAAVAFLLVPYLARRMASGTPEAESTPRTGAAAAHPILSNAVGTVRYGEGYGMPTAVVDPSVYEDAILFATGASENACDRLVRLNPETGAFESIAVARENDTLRYPSENADTIVYIDAKDGGGGSIRKLDKATQENVVLCKFSCGMPRLQFEAPYLVWTERALDGSGKLMVCDSTTGELLTLALFGADSPYAASDPSIKSGQVLYADADPSSEGESLIRTLLLSDGSGWDYAAGGYVHDPKSAGDRWAYLSGDHGAEGDLYIVVGGGKARRIARGAVDFAITSTCVVYNRDETVFAYVFSDDKTYILSETGANAQLVAAGGDYAIWRDRTAPGAPVWQFIRVV